MRRATILALTGWLTLTGFLGGCSANPATGRRELILISREQEIAMGSEAGPQFEAEFGGKLADERVQGYVRSVGEKIAAYSDRPMPYEFTVLASDVPNAFALPGGKVYITAGLMLGMANERELAGVLGHEISHVAIRHNVKGIQRQMGAAVVVEIAGIVIGGSKAQVAEAATKVATGMANLHYSREDEYQADEFGIKYMTRAGYNPYGMVELLTTLLEMSEAEGGSLTEMFQTHPLTGKRIDEARGFIESDPAYAKFSPDQPDLHAGQFLEMRSLLKSALGK